MSNITKEAQLQSYEAIQLCTPSVEPHIGRLATGELVQRSREFTLTNIFSGFVPINSETKVFDHTGHRLITSEIISLIDTKN